jgi:hypothetical protein
MNEQQRAVVQQALEVLKRCQMNEAYRNFEQESQTITALQQLLEQPASQRSENTPWVGLTPTERKEIERRSVYVESAIRMTDAKLREKNGGAAQPAAWVGLTDEQANLLINGRGDKGDDDYVEPTGDGFGLTDADLVKLIRRVEAHHGIGVKL